MATRILEEVSCVLRAGRKKGQFNTLGESRRSRRRARRNFVVFSHRLRAERVEPFAVGLSLGIELDRRRPRRPHGIVSGDCVGSVCGDRMGRFYGYRMGHFCGDRMGAISGDHVGRLICYTESRSTRGNLLILTNKHHNRRYRRLQKRPRGHGTR
jgi:hypothetical protein